MSPFEDVTLEAGVSATITLCRPERLGSNDGDGKPDLWCALRQAGPEVVFDCFFHRGSRPFVWLADRFVGGGVGLSQCRPRKFVLVPVPPACAPRIPRPVYPPRKPSASLPVRFPTLRKLDLLHTFTRVKLTVPQTKAMDDSVAGPAGQKIGTRFRRTRCPSTGLLGLSLFWTSPECRRTSSSACIALAALTHRRGGPRSGHAAADPPPRLWLVRSVDYDATGISRVFPRQ